MRVSLGLLSAAVLATQATAAGLSQRELLKTCTLEPLGPGKDDTDQVSSSRSVMSFVAEDLHVGRLRLRSISAVTTARRCLVQESTISPGR